MKRLTLSTTLGELLNELDFAACIIPSGERIADIKQRDMAHVLGVARARSEREKEYRQDKAQRTAHELLCLWSDHSDIGAAILEAKTEAERSGEVTDKVLAMIGDLQAEAEEIVRRLRAIGERAR